MKTPPAETKSNEEGHEEVASAKGQKALMAQHEHLKYLNEVMADLPVKDLEYVRTLVDNHLGEKRARKKLVAPVSADKLKAAGVSSPSISKYDIEREDEADYI
jgi:hypothetical protein